MKLLLLIFLVLVASICESKGLRRDLRLQEKSPPFFGLSPTERSQYTRLTENKWNFVRECAIGVDKLDSSNREFLALKDDFLVSHQGNEILFFLPRGVRRLPAPSMPSHAYVMYQVPYQPREVSKAQWGFFNISWVDGEFHDPSRTKEPRFIPFKRYSKEHPPLAGADQLWTSPATYDAKAAASLLDKILRALDRYYSSNTKSELFYYSKRNFEGTRHCENLAKAMPNTPVSRIIHKALQKAEDQVKPQFGLSAEEQSQYTSIGEDKWNFLLECTAGVDKLDSGFKDFLALRDDLIVLHEGDEAIFFMPKGMKRFPVPTVPRGHDIRYWISYRPSEVSTTQWGVYNIYWRDGEFTSLNKNEPRFVPDTSTTFSPMTGEPLHPATRLTSDPLAGSGQLWTSPTTYDAKAAAFLLEKTLSALDRYYHFNTRDEHQQLTRFDLHYRLDTEFGSHAHYYSKSDLRTIRRCESLAKAMPNTPVSRIINQALQDAGGSLEPEKTVGEMRLMVTLNPTTVEMGGRVLAHATIENYSSQTYHYDVHGCSFWSDWHLDNSCLVVDDQHVACLQNIPSPATIPPGGRVEKDMAFFANCPKGSTVKFHLGFREKPTLWSQELTLNLK